jgi:hypothetical protein
MIQQSITNFSKKHKIWNLSETLKVTKKLNRSYRIKMAMISTTKKKTPGWVVMKGQSHWTWRLKVGCIQLEQQGK